MVLVWWMVSNVENICITVFSVNTVLENTDNVILDRTPVFLMTGLCLLTVTIHSSNRTPVSDQEPGQRVCSVCWRGWSAVTPAFSSVLTALVSQTVPACWITQL